jgi:pimeloyl-ACP methyl ester carboxylesterase
MMLPACQERERNREAIPGAELITIDQAGHFTSLERPAEVATRILSRRAN